MEHGEEKESPFKMKKLYFVTISAEGVITIPVMAESDKEAEIIASGRINDSDIDIDIDRIINSEMSEKCPKIFENQYPENQDHDDDRLCFDIIEDQNREKERLEAEALEPKLPGFGS